MNKSRLWMYSVILITYGSSILYTGCKNKTDDKQPAAEQTVSAPETYLTAVERYLTDTIGSRYDKEDVCIPYYTIVGTDEQNSDDILVWGDYWVLNYHIVGDTLKAVSGGNHPGLMHVKQSDGHFTVTSFDAVEDGSHYLPSAKRIFGDKFSDYQKAYSDEKQREETRRKAVINYVEHNNLPCTVYQDFGWDPVKFR